MLNTPPRNINGYIPFFILLYTLPRDTYVYIPFLILLYTLPRNINGYIPFLILLYTLPRNINGISHSSQICWSLLWMGENILSSHHYQQLPPICCLRVLYFVNAIKISILFPTSGLIISHSLTFLLGYNICHGKNIKVSWWL